MKNKSQKTAMFLAYFTGSQSKKARLFVAQHLKEYEKWAYTLHKKLKKQYATVC